MPEKETLSRKIQKILTELTESIGVDIEVIQPTNPETPDTSSNKPTNPGQAATTSSEEDSETR